MGPEDLAKLVLVSGPDAGGGRVLFTVTRISLEQNRYESSVWVYEGESARVLLPAMERLYRLCWQMPLRVGEGSSAGAF
jgi:dipeptidyl aminopeptidase/acylaminoacyl peptidase